MHTKMIEGTLVKDHMTHMVSLFNKMKILKVELDVETKVNMILETFLDSFKQFKHNYSINKMLVL